MTETVLISPPDMRATFLSILLQQGFSEAKASSLAEVFTANSVDGVYSHGVNRFPVFVQYVKEGVIDKTAEPSMSHAFNGIEQWNGNGGAGPLNAIASTERATQLAQQYGIGCVALANTNHWMRGGYYGWQAARQGFTFIGWTNTTALMPAWGAVDAKLGNNPLVMAVPYNDEAIVLDAAMSQYSFGALELAAAKEESLGVYGGYDGGGKLTTNPEDILQSRRPLPIGYWKGAGLSLLLDVLGAVLSGGLSTSQITQLGKERSLSQVFVCIDTTKLANYSLIKDTIRNIITDYQQSETEAGMGLRFPGERVLQTRKENLEKGIPVLQAMWEKVQQLLPMD